MGPTWTCQIVAPVFGLLPAINGSGYMLVLFNACGGSNYNSSRGLVNVDAFGQSFFPCQLSWPLLSLIPDDDFMGSSVRQSFCHYITKPCLRCRVASRSRWLISLTRCKPWLDMAPLPTSQGATRQGGHGSTFAFYFHPSSALPVVGGVMSRALGLSYAMAMDEMSTAKAHLTSGLSCKYIDNRPCLLSGPWP
jgi:hypothetical protein